MRQPWSQAPLTRQLCSAPCRSALYCSGLPRCALVCSVLCQPPLTRTDLLCSALLRHFRCFSSDSEMQSSIRGKGKYAPRTRGDLVYIDNSYHPWPLIIPSSCKWELQILKVWLVQKTLSWLVRVEMLCLFRAAELLLDGDSFIPIGWNALPGTPL